MRTFKLTDHTTLSGHTAHPDHRRRGGGYLGEHSFLPGDITLPVQPVEVPEVGGDEPGRRRLKKGAFLARRDAHVTEDEREAILAWEAREHGAEAVDGNGGDGRNER